MVGPLQLHWINRLLCLLIGVCAIGTLLVVGRAVTAPALDSTLLGKPVAAAEEVTDHRRLQPLSWYAPLWQRDLRQSLQTQVQAPAVAQADPAIELPKLLGTFLEQESVYAQLETADGRAKLYASGDAVGPFTLTVVESTRVCLRQGTDEYWLELPQPGGTESSLAIRSAAP
ncbi:MAG: hypothetical protein O7D91_17040 [Planctomycetota bacterium]|nr:hypothetical protein [Planctomycetota bacterium]